MKLLIRSSLLAFFMLSCILSLPLFSAFLFDNVKEFDKLAGEKYGEITIKNSFGLGEDLVTYKLLENTDYCLTNCYAEGIVTLGIPAKLFEDVKFTDLSKSFAVHLKEYHVFYSDRTEQYTYTENLESWRCEFINKIEDGKPSPEKTELCGYYPNPVERTGIRKVWKKAEGVELPEGTYSWRIEGKKRLGESVDWIGQTDVSNIGSFELSEWATWTDSLNVGLGVYYNMSGHNDSLGRYNLSCAGVGCGDAGIIGASCLFDETGGSACTSIDVFDNTDLNFTINVWIKPRSIDEAFYFHKYNGNGWLNQLTGGKYVYHQDGTNYATNFVAEVNQWSMVTTMRNGTGIFVYVNGTQRVAGASLNPVGTTQVLKFGRDNTGASQEIDGWIDEASIWTRSLTEAEIVDLYNDSHGLTWKSDTPPATSTPTITLNSPSNYLNTSTPLIMFNCSAVDSTNLTNISLIIGGKLNMTKAVVDVNTTEYNKSYSFADGIYNWTCNATNIDNKMGTASYRFFTIDTEIPLVYVVLPSNNSEIQTLNATVLTAFNVSVIHALPLSNCFYFNGSNNVSVTCRNNATVNLSQGFFTFRYYANDSVSLLGENSTTIFINYLKTLKKSDSTEIEGDNATIIFYVNATNITTAAANITYHNVVYQMDKTITGNNATFYKTFAVPLVAADLIINWTINYSINSMYHYYNDTQIVFNIPSLNITPMSCDNASYQFNLLDEQNFSSYNGTFEYNFWYGPSANSSMVKTFGSIASSNIFYMCANLSIAPNWTIGKGEIFYNREGFAERRYYIFSGTVIDHNLKNITLYDLENVQQTSFQLTVESTSLDPYDNVYVSLLRWYPDLDSYKIIDMGQTDEKGQTVTHLKIEDVDYRIGIYYQNGSLIKLGNPIRLVCLSTPCAYTFKVSPSENDYTSFLNVQFSFDFNETTNIWSFVFSDPSGMTSTMNLTVYKDTGTSSYAICSDQLSGIVGSLTCNTTSYSGSLRGVVFRSASPGIPLVSKIVHVGTTAFKSTFGLWLSLLIALPIIFIFAIMSPTTAIIGGVVALIPAFYFGSINMAILGGLAILGGIVIHFLKRIS